MKTQDYIWHRVGTSLCQDKDQDGKGDHGDEDSLDSCGHCSCIAEVFVSVFENLPEDMFEAVVMIDDIVHESSIDKKRRLKMDQIETDLRATLTYDLIHSHVKAPVDMSHDDVMCLKATLVLFCCPSEVWEKVFGDQSG